MTDAQKDDDAMAAIADAPAPGPSLLLRAIWAVPLIGWMIRDAMTGTKEAPLWLAFNLVALLILGIVLIGYPVLILFGLFGTFSMMVLLMALTVAR